MTEPTGGISTRELTPREIVAELDRYVVGQHDAKRAVAIALRNRWRRLKAPTDMREDITPKNIIMIGPTGVGKTEIARRLAKLADAPFYKVEASKFTEVGYVGKDAESMIRDLVEIAVGMVREREKIRVKAKAEEIAEERLLDLLLPPKPQRPAMMNFEMGESVEAPTENQAAEEVADSATREKLRKMLREGKLDERKVDLELGGHSPANSGGIPVIEVMSAGGSMDDIAGNLRDMIGQMMPQQSKKRRKVPVSEARQLLIEDEAQRLVDMENVAKLAVELAQNSGIIFIDEIDKIASPRGEGRGGPDVSREGVQRDLLPIVEGSTVSTKYGFVRTDHILFVAAGAFHIAKPSDLIPELQGRFPIRVELGALGKDELLKVLTEPRSSLVRQYQALMAAEDVTLEFSVDGLDEIAGAAAELNKQMENIGARRLHAILERVMDEISFDAPERKGAKITINGELVKAKLAGLVKDQDLRRFIL